MDGASFIQIYLFNPKNIFKLPKSFKINAQTVVTLQSACKVTYFFTHVQAREKNIARFSVANVCGRVLTGNVWKQKYGTMCLQKKEKIEG